MRTRKLQHMLIAAVTTLAVPISARSQTPSAAEVLSRAGKAADPKGSLASHRSVRASLDVEVLGVGISGKSENYSARPDKFVSQTTLGPIGTIVAGYDGTVGYIVNPATGPQLMDSLQLARSRHLSGFDAAAHRPDTFKSMSEPVVETFEGKSCYKLHLVSTTTFEYDAYFEVETGFRRGLRYDEKGPMGMVPVTMVFDDYRDFGGVMIAGKVTQKTPTLSLVQKTTKVEFDGVADSMFVLPPAIKALAGK